MKADKINITETVDSARKLLETDKQISPALRAMFEMLLMIICFLAGKLGLNSQNSSKPPSTDPNRKKNTRTIKEIINLVVNLAVWEKI